MRICNEEWRPILDAPGYLVSDQGRVKSIDRWVVCRRLTVTYKSRRTGRILRPGIKASGHVSVALGKGRSVDVHVLVLRAFVGLAPDGEEARHKNGKPADNRLCNLEWAPRRRNTQDRKYHEGATNHKLTPAQVKVLRDADRRGVAHGYWSAKAREFGVTHAAIYGARKLHHRDVE